MDKGDCILVQIFNDLFNEASFGHSVLMFGYKPTVAPSRRTRGQSGQSGFYRIKDSELEIERQIPLKYQTIEEIRSDPYLMKDYKDGYDVTHPDINPGDYVLSDVGYVLRFSEHSNSPAPKMSN